MSRSRVPKPVRKPGSREYHLKPSERTRPKFVLSPPGLLDVWRVKEGPPTWRTGASYRLVDDAYSEADKRYLGGEHKVTVEHKAVVEVDDKYYVVNVLPFKFTDKEKPYDPSHTRSDTEGA